MGTVTFGGTPADYALGENGKVATGVRFTVWDARVGGSMLTQVTQGGLTRTFVEPVASGVDVGRVDFDVDESYRDRPLFLELVVASGQPVPSRWAVRPLVGWLPVGVPLGVESMPDRVLTTNGARPVGKGELVTLASDHCVEDGISDETAGLTAAITAALASQSKALRLTPGVTYRTSGTVSTNGVTVEAYGATIKPLDGSVPFYVVDLSGAGPATWRGGTVHGNKAALAAGSPRSAVFCSSNFASVDLTDMTVIESPDRGIQILDATVVTDPALADSGPVMLTRCTVNSAAAYGIFVSRCSGVTLTSCVTNNNGNAGIFVSLCRDVKIKDGTANANVTHGVGYLYCTQVRVANNRCAGNTQSGIAVGGGSATNTASTFSILASNNCAGNGYHGIQVDTTVTAGVPLPWHGTITGNTCDGNTNHGIYVNNSSDAAITGNACRANTQNGVTVAAEDIAVSGNTATGNQNYGVGIFAFGAGVTVGANTVRGNTVGQYQVEAGLSPAPLFAQLSTTPPA